MQYLYRAMSTNLDDLRPVWLPNNIAADYFKGPKFRRAVYESLNTDDSRFYHCSTSYHSARFFHEQGRLRRGEKEEEQIVCKIDLWYLYEKKNKS